MTEAEWMELFEMSALPGDSFHHADHVKMAFLYLQKYPPLEAMERFSFALRHFAEAHGKPGLDHETITWSFLLLIRERMARATSPQTWAEFSSGNFDLLSWQDNILKKYYRPETLNSELARRVFLFPDRL